MIEKSNTNLKGKKVLVVDDSIMNRMVVSVILNDLEVLVAEAEDGKHAINFLKKNTTDLILMDLKMPILNGFEATKIIREELKLTIPIIALTGNSIEEEREKCLEVGMNHYLSKPYDRDVFIDMICNYML
ncbi:response regulator [Polaribacter sp. R77954]|uniref:response regulator n=1 Tax=Polaribacter sp. R77954 TaxID=3093870 RepID=UPI0037C62F29